MFYEAALPNDRPAQPAL